MGLEVRASAEDYLEAILLLQRRMGVVRSVDVAQHLEVSKPSVAIMFLSGDQPWNRLIKGGFLALRGTVGVTGMIIVAMQHPASAWVTPPGRMISNI